MPTSLIPRRNTLVTQTVEVIERCLKGKSLRLELEYYRADGSTIWTEVLHN